MRIETPLLDNWKFCWLDAPVQTPPETAMFTDVSLPHVSNLNEPARESCALYQRSIQIAKAEKKRYFLRFEAVGGVARVFLNGLFLGQHRGGYSRFCLDATDAVRSGENLLAVLSDNTRYPDVNPLMGDFTYWGGIYRPLVLLETEETCFDPTYFGTCGLEVDAAADGTVHLNAHVLGEADAQVRYCITDSNGYSVTAQGLATAPKMAIQVQEPHLWDGQNDPYLYTCTAQLWKDERLLDEVCLPFGFRSVQLTAQKGFFLNGKQLRLNGVAKHQDFHGVGPAVGKELLDTDFALIREIGANALRLSHYQHPQYTYNTCDEKGYVVWAEIPMLSMPEGNEAVVENALQQLTELILQNKHHPSICFWGVQNEIAMMGENLGMYRDVKKLNAKVKELDPSRISVSANLFSVPNNSQLNFLTDGVGYNIYFGWYYGEMKDYDTFFRKFHTDDPGVPLCVSEYGVDANPAYHTDKPVCKDYTEEFQCVFHEQAYGIMEADEKLWGSFVWNMFDFSSAIRNEGGIPAQNCKGLVTYDRQLRKDAFYYYKAKWSTDPFVHITGRRYRNRPVEMTAIKVYANQDQVSLWVNGIPVGSKTGKTVFVFDNIPLNMGENEVLVTAGDCKDTITICRTDAADPSYVYPLKGQGSMVTNWFKQQDASVNLFPEGRFSISDRMGDLLANAEVTALLEAEIPEIMANPRSRKMGGMTLMRVLDYNADTVSQEQVMALNAKLNEIEK